MRTRALVSSTLVLLVLAGCAGDDPEAAPSEYALVVPPDHAAQIVALLNYPRTTFDVLDQDVGLDSRAARNLIDSRNGADGICPSSDDAYFVDLADIDAVPYVGDTAFRALESYAVLHPAPAGELVEGVAFEGWESEAIVWSVDRASLEELDALLDSRAAQALIAARPFASVTEMGPVAYVGASALLALRDAAAGFWSAMTSTQPALAGTFDGVRFDETTATLALEIANEATRDELVAHGVSSTAAGHIIDGRPYATLAAVADTSGVGTATMSALHAYATSGEWGTCTSDFEPSVEPHLADVLFLSESDRPLELVSYAGEGASAPTAELVLALSGAPEGSTAELRDPANYFRALEPASGDADPDAAAAIEAAFGASLTDVIYVAVHLPDSDPYHAEVRVYLVGRTACGDLAGVRSISVET